MSAIGTKRTWLSAPHMSAFEGKADMVLGSNLSKYCGFAKEDRSVLLLPEEEYLSR